MADHYYVNDNAQPNGDHEVHKDGCGWLAMAISKSYLGYYSTCGEAVIVAKRKYWQSNGCAYCSAACHTG